MLYPRTVLRHTSANEPVQEEAAVVREIFERHANRETQQALVRDLNTRAVPGAVRLRVARLSAAGDAQE
jgi:hypothetical protein